MGRLEKTFYWFCLSLVIYICIGFKLVPYIVEDQLVKNLNENLTEKTSLEKVEFNPFTFHAKVHGLKIGNEKKPTVSFDQFGLNFQVLRSLFELHVSFQQVDLKNANINITEYKDKTFNLAKLVKPSDKKDEKEVDEKTKSNIKFLVSKINLENANIHFTKIREGTPYKLSLKNINYVLYDLGTYKNILSSNNFKLDMNDNTNISLVGAFKLEPFTMYGKAQIKDLRLQELLDYKKEILNFELDKNAKLDLALDYEIDISKEFDLNIRTNKFEFKNINLSQNKKDIIKLEALLVEKFNLNLGKQEVGLQNVSFNKPFISMIQDKNGLNLANLVKAESPKETDVEEVKATEEETASKPWKVDLSNLSLNDSSVIFQDKINNTIAKDKNFNFKVSSVKVNGSDLDINKLKLTNPKISFKDNKNLLDVNTNNTIISVNKIAIKDNNLHIDAVNLSKDKLSLSDARSGFRVNTNKSTINVNDIKIKDKVVSLKDAKLSTSLVKVTNKKQRLDISTSNTNLSLNNLLVKDSITSISSIVLKNPKLNFADNKARLKVNASNTNITASTLLVKEGKTSISKIVLKNPKLDFFDNKAKMKVNTKNTNITASKLLVNKGKTSISSISVNSPKLAFTDNKARLYVNTSNTKILASNLNIKGAKTTLSKVTLTNPLLKINNKKDKTTIDIKRINLKANAISSYKGTLTVKNAKLSKPAIKLRDRKSNTNLDTQNLSVYVNRLKQNKYGLNISSIRIQEPKINFYNTKDKTNIIAKNIDLSLVNLKNNKKGFKLAKANLVNPNISVILPKKPEGAKEEKKVKAKPAKKSKGTKLDIGPLNIKNATLNFQDKNLPLPFKTTISKLEGKVSEFKTLTDSTTKLEVNGVVDKYGTTKITGIIDPNNIKVLTDINMIFKNIAMKNFTPYTGKFVGKELESGKLNLDLKYNIQKSDLEAKNNIVITKIKFGKEVKSKDAVSLPLDLAIALLEDSNGVIDLNIPVTGNVDDPKFSVAPIVWKAFVNLIMKAITAPFSLLGAIFGFDENEIKSVNFDFAQSDITPTQKETLDKVSQILAKRKSIAIKLVPSYDKAKDLKALKVSKYEKLLSNELPSKQSKNYERKLIDLLEELYDDYDRDYDKVKEKHTTKDKLDKKAYKKELSSFIISKQKVTNVNLEKLAKDRVLNIKTYLTKDKAIPVNQIVISKKIKVNTQSAKTSNIDLEIDKIK